MRKSLLIDKISLQIIVCIYVDHDSGARDALSRLLKLGSLSQRDRIIFPMLADYERIVGKLGRNQEPIYDTVAPDNLAKIPIPENNMAGNDKRPFAKPESYGGTKSEDFNEWLKTFNRAAKINKWDEDDKILYLPLYLKKTALAIFDIFSDKNENATFLDAVGHLKSKLVDPVHEETTRQKLENRNKLPTETYTEYTADIIKLCHILEPQMSEKRIVGYVLRGLDVGALQHVAFMDNASVEDLEKNLAKYERSRFLLDKKLGMHNASIEQPVQKINVVDTLEKKLNDLSIVVKNLSRNVGQSQNPNPNRQFGNRSGNFSPHETNQNNFQRQPYSNNNNYNDRDRNTQSHNPNPNRQFGNRSGNVFPHETNQNNFQRQPYTNNNYTQSTSVNYRTPINPNRTRFCTYCKRNNHWKDDCFFLSKNSNTGSRA
ncbi:probable serine/threonine-protein kinase DDB_G0276461 [Nilaparvata lugens]|uniref:probable serine/threonine-protein kinase DDB_G0276461 n=1 Tax=Nilaparvata lugens TaxID=108931 RepID=UPI00193E4BDC|nr:probable serine/threonine-protein kinase DDB_G0276461 [Nilaparvata lugens]